VLHSAQARWSTPRGGVATTLSEFFTGKIGVDALVSQLESPTGLETSLRQADDAKVQKYLFEYPEEYSMLKCSEIIFHRILSYLAQQGDDDIVSQFELKGGVIKRQCNVSKIFANNQEK